MGLDFDNSEAHWSYSGFMEFRKQLWTDAGFDGNLEELYNDNSFLDLIDKDHPLFDFFNHSDCDGKLTVKQMKKIAPAMKEIVSKWPEDDFDRDNALLLVKGMEDCIKNKLPLEFC